MHKPTITGIAALVAAGIAVPMVPALWTPDTPAVVVAAPLEDEPGWDCHTMGNRRCEPITEARYRHIPAPVPVPVLRGGNW